MQLESLTLRGRHDPLVRSHGAEALSELSLGRDRQLERVLKILSVQIEGYKRRYQLQPGGLDLYDLLTEKLKTPESQRFQRLYVEELYGSLRGLSRDVVSLLRVFGTELLNAGVELKQLDETSFNTSILTGLKDRRGNTLSMSLDTLLAIATITKAAWNNTFNSNANPEHQSLTATQHGEDSRMLVQDIREIKDPRQMNYQTLSALLFAESLARLSEGDFSFLSESLAPGNPHNLRLSFTVTKPGVGVAPQYIKLNGEVRSQQRPKAIICWDDIPKIDPIEQEISKLRIAALNEERAELFVPACATLLSLSGDRKEHRRLLGLIASFNEVRIARENWLLAASYVGNMRSALQLPDDNFIALLKSRMRMTAPGSVLLRKYASYRDARARALKVISSMPVNERMSDARMWLADPSDIGKIFPGVRAIIDSSLFHGDVAKFREQGGIFNDNYDIDFFEELHTKNGNIIVITTRGELAGFIIYFAPELGGTSDWELIMIKDQYQARGHYTDLVGAMILALQLHGATKVRCSAYTENARGVSAIINQSFMPLSAHSAPRVINSSTGEPFGWFYGFNLNISPDGLSLRAELAGD